MRGAAGFLRACKSQALGLLSMNREKPNARPSQIVVDVLGGDQPRVWDTTQPLIFADDLAAIRGDGVFETMMLRDGHVKNVELHRSRFLSSAAMLNLPVPDMDLWLAATELAVEQFHAQVGELAESDEAALRWVYSRGRESTGAATGWIVITVMGEELTRARTSGLKVMTAERGFRIDLSQRSPWALVGAKTLSYAANMAALRYAKSKDLDDVIFVSDEGHLMEGPTSSIIVMKGNTLLTPPIEAGVLPGTSQAVLFRIAAERGWDVAYRTMTVEDLLEADGVWLVSSVRAAAPVTEVDGQALQRPSNAAEVEAMVWEAVTS